MNKQVSRCHFLVDVSLLHFVMFIHRHSFVEAYEHIYIYVTWIFTWLCKMCLTGYWIPSAKYIRVVDIIFVDVTLLLGLVLSVLFGALFCTEGSPLHETRF